MSDPARIVVTAGGEPRAFDGATVVVGRSDGCDVVVDATPVSRRHFEITLRSDGLWIRDLDSTHGTWIDGKRLADPRRVAAGVRVQLGASGPSVIVSCVGGALPTAAPPRTAAYVFGVFIGATAAITWLAFGGGADWIAAARLACGR